MPPLASAFIAELSEVGVQSIAEAIHPAAGKVVGFFKGVWQRYRAKQKKQEEKAEVERIARMTAAEMIAEVRPAVLQAFPNNPRLQQECELYFSQMPGAVTRSLRRKDDPSGKSAPDDFDLDSPEKLAVLYPASAPQFRPGDDLSRRAGKWRLIDPVGSGGFGEVWKARNLLTRQFGAVKFCTDPAARLDLIRHELTQALRLNDDDHGWPAGVVPVLDFDLDGEHPWILFEYLDGGTLEDLMHELAGVPVPQRVPRAVSLWLELTTAVVPLHSLKKTPLVHRDLKPANVLRDFAGRLRITDLGLGGSAIETERSLESQGGYHRVTGRLPTQLQGSYSLHYASKQQRAGQPTTTQDDVFSLGVIAYQMLTGKLDTGPGTDADDELTDLGVPADLVKVVKACASDNPTRRPANAMALVERLSALAPGERRDVSPPVTPPGERRDVSPPVLAGERRDVSPPVPLTTTADSVPEKEPADSRRAVRPESAAPSIPIVPLVPAAPPPLPVRKAGDRYEITLPGGVKMAFAWCPPGTFLMGSPDTEKERSSDEQQHEVTLTQGFWMGIHPVTQAQYQAVMGTNPSNWKDDPLPVEQVSWDDAQAFCAELKQKGWVELRLPTEAEWEYAARGGTLTPFYWGSELNGTQANCDGNYPYGTAKTGPDRQATSPVGHYAAEYPHPWGLTDVIGNVWEWCADWYDEKYYARSPQSDPACMNGEPKYRVLRGGSWYDRSRLCRAALRMWGVPTYRRRYFGFRLSLPGLMPQG